MQSKKGHNSRMTRLVEEKKNLGPLIFHVHATYIISRFKHKRFLSFSAANELRTDGQKEGRTDRQTDGQAQTNMPPQLLRSWGHKNPIDADIIVFGMNSGDFLFYIDNSMMCVLIRIALVR